MGAGKRAQNYARPVAELIGIAADDPIVRYGVLSLTFLFLAAAAYLFGPVAQMGAIATLALALGLIVFIVYWWFLEEARKRRVMLLEEQPRANDSHNPDLRDEVVFACVVLFIVTAMLLQTLNDTSLHYTVADDVLGIKALACADAMPGSFCAENTRLFELPAWLFFTFQSFVTTIPMADQVSDYAANMTGVKPTAETPAFISTGLRFILGGFFLTLVIGMFNKIGRQIDTAVEALALSPLLAAGMGPIILTRLQQVVAEKNGDIWIHAVQAIADIAERYDGAKAEVRRLFAVDFETRFCAIPLKTEDSAELRRMDVLTAAICAMHCPEGLEAIRERILMPREFVKTKRRLVKILVASLDPDLALAQLQLLPTADLKKSLAATIHRELALLQPVTDDEDDDEEMSPAAKPRARKSISEPDERQAPLL